MKRKIVIKRQIEYSIFALDIFLCVCSKCQSVLKFWLIVWNVSTCLQVFIILKLNIQSFYLSTDVLFPVYYH